MDDNEPTSPHATTFMDQVLTDAKVVISIDFGTTFSGISYAYREIPNVVNCRAPGAKNNGDSMKVPTILLKTTEGWLFGLDAVEKYNLLLEEHREEYEFDAVDSARILHEKDIQLFRDFKMVLLGVESGFETLVARSTTGADHLLLELVTTCLEHLSTFARNEVKKGFAGALNISNDDVMWVLTVPSIWNDFGKAFMRKAAYRAGMIEDESSKRLLLGLEPECAALAVHKSGLDYRLLEEGSSFMVLDCGGGTVDVTVHKVSQAKPLLLDEICPSRGGPWGGIHVDFEFQRFLERLFGNDIFQRLLRFYPVEVEEVMESFRSLKENFLVDSQPNSNRISLSAIVSGDPALEIGLANLTCLVDAYNRDPQNVPFDLTNKQVAKLVFRDATLAFSSEQMLRFFESTMEKICDCVKIVLDEYEDVGVIALVGGYGSGQVLGDRIRSEFGLESRYEKVVLVPDGKVVPQAAIVHGASYFGLHTTVLGSRISRHTYGIQIDLRWYAGCGFDVVEAETDSNDTNWVRGAFSSIVKRGQRISPNETFTKGQYQPTSPGSSSLTFKVFKSDSYSPRRTQDCQLLGRVEVLCNGEEDTFEVRFIFGSELTVEVIRGDGRSFGTVVDMD